MSDREITIRPDTNTYLVASAGLIECHECSCHISPPCAECTQCEACNPCWTCDEIHDGPRNDECLVRSSSGKAEG